MVESLSSSLGCWGTLIDNYLLSSLVICSTLWDPFGAWATLKVYRNAHFPLKTGLFFFVVVES